MYMYLIMSQHFFYFIFFMALTFAWRRGYAPKKEVIKNK